jgi:hypothetical protein
MLKTEGVYEFDTQRDMFDNLLGAIVAVTLYVLVRRRAGRGAAAESQAANQESPQVENAEWRATAPPLQSRLNEGSAR